MRRQGDPTDESDDEESPSDASLASSGSSKPLMPRPKDAPFSKSSKLRTLPPKVREAPSQFLQSSSKQQTSQSTTHTLSPPVQLQTSSNPLATDTQPGSSKKERSPILELLLPRQFKPSRKSPSRVTKDEQSALSKKSPESRTSTSSPGELVSKTKVKTRKGGLTSPLERQKKIPQKRSLLEETKETGEYRRSKSQIEGEETESSSTGSREFLFKQSMVSCGTEEREKKEIKHTEEKSKRSSKYWLPKKGDFGQDGWIYKESSSSSSVSNRTASTDLDLSPEESNAGSAGPKLDATTTQPLELPSEEDTRSSVGTTSATSAVAHTELASEDNNSSSSTDKLASPTPLRRSRRLSSSKGSQSPMLGRLGQSPQKSQSRVKKGGLPSPSKKSMKSRVPASLTREFVSKAVLKAYGTIATPLLQGRKKKSPKQSSSDETKVRPESAPAGGRTREVLAGAHKFLRKPATEEPKRRQIEYAKEKLKPHKDNSADKESSSGLVGANPSIDFNPSLEVDARMSDRSESVVSHTTAQPTDLLLDEDTRSSAGSALSSSAIAKLELADDNSRSSADDGSKFDEPS